MKKYLSNGSEAKSTSGRCAPFDFGAEPGYCSVELEIWVRRMSMEARDERYRLMWELSDSPNFEKHCTIGFPVFDSAFPGKSCSPTMDNYFQGHYYRHASLVYQLSGTCPELRFDCVARAEG